MNSNRLVNPGFDTCFAFFELSQALSKHLDTIHVLDLAKHIEINNANIYGSLLVLDRLMETRGINSVLSEIATKHEKLRYDLKKVLFTLITSRFYYTEARIHED